MRQHGKVVGKIQSRSASVNVFDVACGADNIQNVGAACFSSDPLCEPVLQKATEELALVLVVRVQSLPVNAWKV